MEKTPSIAVVTGASRGIGRAVATQLAASGHTVIAMGRSAEQLDQVAAASGAFPIVLDVSDAAAVAQAWSRVESEFGVPTLVVNNAGLAGENARTWERDPGDWWRVFEVNVFGTFLISRAALPGMIARGSGRIVNVASNAAFHRVDSASDGPIYSAYMASKAAVIRFTEAVAAETAGLGVQAFAISPGMVKSDMTAATFAEDWDDPDLWSPPELTADLIEFIDSGELDSMSGRYIHVAQHDWRSLGARSAEVLANDEHALRVRTT